MFNAKWLYMRNNAYDLIAKIIGDTAYVLTQTEDFPAEDNDIPYFMQDVMEQDYSDEWNLYPAEEVLNDGNEVLWEKDLEVV